MYRSLVVFAVALGFVVLVPAQTPPLTLGTASDDASAPLRDDDFGIKGVSYAMVLYIEGKVFIRPPDQVSFHALTEDEPIARGSVLVTRENGILDFATAPGEAIRMNAGTVLQVTQLPPIPASTTDPLEAPSSPATPPATIVTVHKGSIFSALGRADGQPIDFRVRTPQGVAGARGTFFETDATAARSDVTMFHGKVSLQTYTTGQSADIEAGSTQGFIGTRLNSTLSPGVDLSAAEAPAKLTAAAGLLENACGYGAVRGGLSTDTLHGLEQKGFQLPSDLKDRFEHIAHQHFTHRPGFLKDRDRADDRSSRDNGKHR